MREKAHLSAREMRAGCAGGLGQIVLKSGFARCRVKPVLRG
jgi:hypothetical protein